MASRYHEVYDSWKRDPQAFWAAAAEDIDWFKRWDKVFDPDAGVYGRWFTGAECNTAYNCLDRHVERGRADQVALIHDSAITGKIRRFTYRELRDEVVALAAVLRDNGIGKGDRVIIYMPMVAGSGDRHARLRPHRRRAFGGVRRLRLEGTGDPHRRRAGRSW